MDSPLVSDSSSESQYESKKAEKDEFNSVCSTDDELNLQLSPQSCVSLPNNTSRPSVKQSTNTQEQQQGEIVSQPMPRTIFGFLERKIELNKSKNATNNNNNQTVLNNKKDSIQEKVNSSFYFKLKEHEIVSEEGDDDEESFANSSMKVSEINANQGNQQKSGQKKFVVYLIEAVEEKKQGNRVIVALFNASRTLQEQ